MKYIKKCNKSLKMFHFELKFLLNCIICGIKSIQKINLCTFTWNEKHLWHEMDVFHADLPLSKRKPCWIKAVIFINRIPSMTMELTQMKPFHLMMKAMKQSLYQKHCWICLQSNSYILKSKSPTLVRMDGMMKGHTLQVWSYWKLFSSVWAK